MCWGKRSKRHALVRCSSPPLNSSVRCRAIRGVFMGTDMSAFIEYDTLGLYEMEGNKHIRYREEILILQPDDPQFPPFSMKDEIESVSGYYQLNTGSKNYAFFA